MDISQLDALAAYTNQTEKLGDLYHFNNEVLGYDKMATEPHREMCDSVQYGGDRQLHLWPRGHFKSTCITIGYSLYLLAQDPNIRIFIGNSVLQNAKSFLREIKGHLRDNEKLKEIMGETVNKDDKWTETEIILKTRTVNKKEPSIQVAGVGQSLVSQHYDVMFLDDLVDTDNINTAELIQKTIDWYKMALSLLEPDGKLVAIGTRYHYGDLYGYLIDKDIDRKKNKFNPEIHSCYKKDKNGKKLSIFPSRFTLEKLRELKEDQGSYIFSCQYLNEPVDAENAKFKKTDFRYYTDETLGDKELYTIYMIDRAYSLAKTADYTAHVIVSIDKNNNWYVRHAIRTKESEKDLIKRIFDNRRTFDIDRTGIEQKAFNDTIAPVLREEMDRRGEYFQVEELKGRASKISRIEALVPRFESHKVHFKKGMDDLEDELLRFPSAQHDDTSDALAYGNDLARRPVDNSKKKTPQYHKKTGRVIGYR